MSVLRQVLGLVFVLVLTSYVVGCGETAEVQPPAPEQATPSGEEAAPTVGPASDGTRLDSYTLAGLTFSYYLIPAGLDDEGVLEAARGIHESEPEAQLVLVDDDSRVGEYIAWAKASSAGDESVEMPTEWADAHIVANLQRLMGGGWMLYRSNGYEEMGRID